jgi:hypothetical protein
MAYALCAVTTRMAYALCAVTTRMAARPVDALLKLTN